MANIASLIQDDHQRYPLLKLAGETGDETDVDVYVVGGYVRDLMMNRELSDMDIMVVGNGIEFASRFAKRLGVSTIVPYEEFGTAMIPCEDLEIEVATARAETYERDSRKPRVSASGLEEDLMRRDFTVNAMAIGLGETNLGDLHDPCGGLKDLQDQILRTPLDPDTTFSDDPLRMMRLSGLRPSSDSP